MMENEPLYLRQDIQFEPLIDQWYAWSHLIPPATAARNITERHLKIINSYVSAPQIHAAAVKNPKLLGGPFIDYDGKRVDEIKALREKTVRERSHLIELSEALARLNENLQLNAAGYSLEPLYSQVPDILKGYVELSYDLNNHPSFRLIEPLLYKSQFYDRSMQSVMVSKTNNDDRAFVLSTPRLESDQSIHLRVSFDDEILDRLFRLKLEPKPYREIDEMLNLPRESDDLLKSFLTAIPPRRSEPYQGGGVRWRYFGHACILVETSHQSLLFDPVLSYEYQSDISRYTYLDLPDRIDYVVITHNHQDHVLFETLLQLRNRIGTIIVPKSGSGSLQDPSLKLILSNCGFQNVIELGEMEEIPLTGGGISALPFIGEHADLSISVKNAYLIQLYGRSLFFAADSSNLEPRLYEHLHEIVGDVDAMFLGMECDGAPLSWLYGPLLTRRFDRAMDESRRLTGSNYEQALDLVERFHCKGVYVYAMGQEPWLNYIMSIKYTSESRPIVESDKLIQECRRRGVEVERLFGQREVFCG
jgi:L-ascorbate metabolism protein UlaG (beta-lactamase superfamily)